MKQETEVHYQVGKVILGFLPIFKKSKASSTFESLTSVCLSRCQSDMIPPVQMRRRPTAFSRVSTGDSDIPSSCQMNDEPAFKPLQGNPTLFLVRESRYPLQFRQKTQGPSHIPIAEGRLLLRCLFKVGLPFQQNPGNQLSSSDNMECIELSSSSCAEIGVPIN